MKYYSRYHKITQKSKAHLVPYLIIKFYWWSLVFWCFKIYGP